MTEVLARGSLGTPTRVRAPGFAVMTECLRIQASARPRGFVARLFGQNPIEPDARSWYRGALGEIRVATVLRELPTTWTVLRAVDPTSDGSDLLLGPAGAFLVATKNHSRQRVVVDGQQLLVNTRRTNHLRDARHEALRVSRLLGIAVTPVLVMVDPASLSVRERPDLVEVTTEYGLGRYLARRRSRLTEDAVASLVATAAIDGSWSAHLLDETLRHETRFARLRADVDAALRRRVLWGAAGVLVVVALVAAGLGA